MACELYAMLDGLRRATYSLYRGKRGMQDKKTSIFFERAAKNLYEGLPPILNAALAESYNMWFPRLRLWRTQTTHGETGTCSYMPETGKINYWHPASNDLNIDDVVAYLNHTYSEISALAERFFEHSYIALFPLESRHVCGIYQGRFYERMVAATADLSFPNGRCWSRAWFESEPGKDCPLREQCNAFRHPVPAEERDARFAQSQPTA